MPKRKENIDPPSTDVIRIRIPIKTKRECLKAKEASAYWWQVADSSFFGYLLELGLETHIERNKIDVKKAKSSEIPKFSILSTAAVEKAKKSAEKKGG